MSDKWQVKRKRNDGNLFNFLAVGVVVVASIYRPRNKCRAFRHHHHPPFHAIAKQMSKQMPYSSISLVLVISMLSHSLTQMRGDKKNAREKKIIYSFHLVKVSIFFFIFVVKSTELAHRFRCHLVWFICRMKVREVSFATQLGTINFSSAYFCFFFFLFRWAMNRDLFLNRNVCAFSCRSLKVDGKCGRRYYAQVHYTNTYVRH